MFTIRLETNTYAPSRTVVLRWGPNWNLDRGGVYVNGAWEFDLDEIAFPTGIEFKFVLVPGIWDEQANVQLDAADLVGDPHTYREGIDVTFPNRFETVTERGVVSQKYFVRNLDPNIEWDVIVIGSGMGGGLLASRLADAGKQVLLLEAGSYLFPTHVGNLARRLFPGQFQKHVWSLWQDFQVVNYVNTPGSLFGGAQAFNLGGRSLFWGGLIPRQTPWELATWPQAVRIDLLAGGGYDAAEAALNRVAPLPSDYQTTSVARLDAVIPGFVAEDASMAIQYAGATPWSLPAGMFSTADLLMEDRLLTQGGHVAPTINLNFAVHTVDIDPNDPTRVVGITGWDMLGERTRSFRGAQIVLGAGTIESAKIALQSGLSDPNGLIGQGITDHMIRYRHFLLPAGNPFASTTSSAKVLLRDPAAAADHHAFDIVVELGANLNQGRYVDPHDLAADELAVNGGMLCELVFMYYAPLEPDNRVTLGGGDPIVPVNVTVNPATPAAPDLAAADAIAAAFFAATGAQPAPGEQGLWLQPAGLGGVAHEVGTLRMADDSTGVVDENLKFLTYVNLYACDNSVFPTSPAANPSLTLAALAIRLANHLSQP